MCQAQWTGALHTETPYLGWQIEAETDNWLADRIKHAPMEAAEGNNVDLWERDKVVPLVVAAGAEER